MAYESARGLRIRIEDFQFLNGAGSTLWVIMVNTRFDTLTCTLFVLVSDNVDMVCQNIRDSLSKQLQDFFCGSIFRICLHCTNEHSVSYKEMLKQRL